MILKFKNENINCCNTASVTALHIVMMNFRVLANYKHSMLAIVFLTYYL